MSSLHRIYATICRLRASWGFGVHTPNVYGLLTDVLREHRPYYAYTDIRRLSAGRPGHTLRVNKLLFRLVNYYRPDSVFEVGTGDGHSLQCMSMARQSMALAALEGRKGEVSTPTLASKLGEGRRVGFLHIAQTPAYREAYEAALPLTDARSLFIVEGIHATREKRAWWKQVEQDVRTGVTIDLYDVGLVFFDLKRPRRNFRFTF